jgi:hypothetical protein
MLDGSYQFDLLPDGEYTLIAKTFGSGKAASKTRVSVQLHGSDATDVVMDLATGAGR